MKVVLKCASCFIACF
jgi:choline transporter-like protein 2/4/5